MEIERRHLTTVLNALYDADHSTVPVTHPSDDLGTLCTLALAADGRCTVSFEVDAAEYANRRSTVNERYGQPAITEVPDVRPFIHAVVGSGLLEPANDDEIAEFLDRHGSPDLTAGHRPVVAGFDTNLMPWRIGEALALHPGSEGVINGYALATGVRDELVWSNKRQDTQSLVDAFGPAFNELWNQPRGPDREGRLGQNYYRKLRDQRYAEEITTEIGDEAIIDGYDEFQANGRKEVLLFSNDRDFVERARSQRILAQWVSLPDELPEQITVSWDAAQQLLYYLAVLFGVIELPTMTVFGVWKGKDGTAWHEERVKIDSRSPKLTPRISRDLDIIAEYESVAE